MAKQTYFVMNNIWDKGSSMKKVTILIFISLSIVFSGPLARGSKAPNFSLPDEKGVTHTLADHIGKKRVILVFYPGDNTPVCTKQLCELRDSYSELASNDSLAIYGINYADAISHLKFSEKNRYPFPLLTDSNWKTAVNYGVSNGKGVTRSVFVIDKNGVIQYVQKGKPPVSEITASFKTK